MKNIAVIAIRRDRRDALLVIVSAVVIMSGGTYLPTTPAAQQGNGVMRRGILPSSPSDNGMRDELLVMISVVMIMSGENDMHVHWIRHG